MAECCAVPGDATPVTVTLYVLGLEEVRPQDAELVLFAVRVTTGGTHGSTVKPVGGFAAVLRLTVPAKLKVLVRVIEIAPALPVLKLTGPSTLMVNSPTCTMELAG